MRAAFRCTAKAVVKLGMRSVFAHGWQDPGASLVRGLRWGVLVVDGTLFVPQAWRPKVLAFVALSRRGWLVAKKQQGYSRFGTTG